ncbi:MAG TPA: thiamine phosphate synthase [Caulobacteraceae bacterium]|nr:thiamine phosphate synthase [Caulobacteraceae bacterium]
MRKALPPLLSFTDPDRTPDVAAVAERLPRGAGIVLRTYGDDGQAARIAAIARRRGLILLIGADERLAASVDANGLHLPERMAAAIPAVRARHPRWLITVAAHSPRAVRNAAKLGADAVVLSTVFESASPSAGKPLGPLRLAAIARTSSIPVYALGGVDMKNARRLRATGVVGIAAVEGVLDALRT